MVSLAFTYYNQPEMLELQKSYWSEYKDINIVLVDDHSEKPPIIDMKNVDVWRTVEDVKWGQPAARNYAVLVSKGDWVLWSDLDHAIPKDVLNQILELNMTNPKVYYLFNRRWKIDGNENGVFKSAFLMNRSKFLELGGFDEEFCGNYGYDDTLFVEMLDRKGMKPIKMEDIYLDLYCGNRGVSDADTKLIRDTTPNKNLFNRKLSNGWDKPVKIGLHYDHINNGK